MDNNQHNVIGVRGPPGIGKSTFSLHLAFHLNPGFPIENVYYRIGDAYEAIVNSPKRQVHDVDEGTNVAMGRTWNNEDQIELVKMLTTARQRNHTLLWNAPNEERLDIILRQDLLDARVTVFQQGIAIIEEKTFNEYEMRWDWQRTIRRLYFPDFKQTNPDFWGLYEGHKERAFFSEHSSLPSADLTNERTIIKVARQKRRLEKARRELGLPPPTTTIPPYPPKV